MRVDRQIKFDLKYATCGRGNFWIRKKSCGLKNILICVDGTLGGVYMGKLAPARVSYRDDFVISYHVYMMTVSFHTMFTWKRSHLGLTKITHALPVPVYLQTDFTPKRVVVSRLHDTVTKSRTGVKFSPRCENRGKLTPGRLAPAWHFVVVSCKQM